MGRYKQPTEPLFEELDGPVMVGIGNWLAKSLDVSELSSEQVLWLHLVLGRGISALWQQFPEVLAPLTLRLLMRQAEDDEDDE